MDVRQIQGKFPGKGGLRELYEKGPAEAFFLVKCWADINTNLLDVNHAFYGVTTTYASSEPMTILNSTKVCSFGEQVVQKLETEYARYENGRYVCKIQASPMCEYMIDFIYNLKSLPETYTKDSALENLSILHTVTNRDTKETLLCIAFLFQLSTSEGDSAVVLSLIYLLILKLRLSTK